ncbi:hypothetical protein OG426_32205 [Streptomyces canus]|uniref:hypothetical protein n=1 Tax=Streptomyces canus TaxID=58343 RepID=UPI00386B1855|nr:hypothetical protein OG426_32205 [Streptomyces canus]
MADVGQVQFWDGRDIPRDYGDGRTRDCVSAIISEWDKPGALGPTQGQPERLREDDPPGRGRLGRFMDPAVTGLGGPAPPHRERLLIHPTGTLHNRPTARTAVPNLFLAGDCIRTGVDLASGEGVNEAARLAVNALLYADNSDAERCRAWELCRPPEREPLKRVDEVRYRLGLPNTFDLG